jgi:hypothetical protein
VAVDKRFVFIALALGLALGLALLLMAGVAGSAASALAPYATVHYVAADGDCAGLSPCYTTLQAAVDAATAGDEVRVAFGAYSAVTSRGGSNQVLYITKDITLRGGYSDDFLVNDPYAFPVLVDACGAGRAVRVTGSVSVTLFGLHVTGGQADRGAGILLEGTSNATVRTNWIYTNTASSRGGGIAILDAAGPVALVSNYVHHNTAASGAGFDVSGSQATLINTMLTDNRLTGTGAGAGLAADGAEVHLLHTTIAHNTGGDGSGLSAAGAVASRIILTNTIVAGQTVGVKAAAGSRIALDSTLWPTGAWANGQRTAGPGTVTTARDYAGDPRFHVYADPNVYYHILANSAAVNKGLAVGIVTDVDDMPRPDGPTPDLGAAEAYTGAGSTAVLNNEPGGDIDVEPPDGVFENSSGSMVWNGHNWVIDSKWTHRYFTDSRNGRRLISYQRAVTADGSGPAGVVYSKGSFHTAIMTVTQQAYTYTVSAVAGGPDFIYEAMEYSLTQYDGKRLVLRSRGCGLGTAVAYLDIYIEDPYAGEAVAALRGDPTMYVYGTTLEQAVLISDETQGAFASLPTFAPRERAHYRLDVNSGADTGGYGYFLRTADLDCQTHDVGSSFATVFKFTYFDSSTACVQELKFLPRVLNEARMPTPTPTATPTRTRTPTPTGVLIRHAYLPLVRR